MIGDAASGSQAEQQYSEAIFISAVERVVKVENNNVKK